MFKQEELNLLRRDFRSLDDCKCEEYEELKELIEKN